MGLDPIPSLSPEPTLSMFGGSARQSYVNAVLADSPDGFWPGDDNSGAFRNIGNGPNNGVTSHAVIGGSPNYQGVSLLTAVTPVASGAYETLSTDRGIVGGGSAPYGFTMELLLKLTTDTVFQPFTLGAANRNNVAIHIAAPSSGSPGRRLHFLFGGVAFNDTGVNLTPGLLYNVAFTRNNAGLNKCFVNGVDSGWSSSVTPDGVENFTQMFGVADAVAGYRALYNTILTPTQLLAHSVAAGIA